MLTRYVAQTQNFLNDTKAQFYSEATISNYVNIARRRCASASGCLRVLAEDVQTKPKQ